MAQETLFPEDILYKILSRLPIKSLARCGCVCKLWLRYIKDPYLHTIHDKQELTPMIIFEQFFPPSARRNYSGKIKISFLRGTTTIMQTDPVLEICFKSCYHSGHFLGSCNGLMVVCFMADNTYRFAVINPLSKQRHNLSPISTEISIFEVECYATGIGFDDSTNTYKTVFSIQKNSKGNELCTMVHSSWTSSWRKITQIPPYSIFGGGVFSDGRLYWLADYINLDDVRQIVWFDVKTEEFGLTMDPPQGCPTELRDFSVFSQLVDLNNEVGLAYIGRSCMKLWILRHEEWALHYSIDLGLILQNYHINWYDIQVSGCWNEDGDILLGHSRGIFLFVYTLKSGDLQEVKLHNQREGFTFLRMYPSSLFSLHTSDYYSC